MLPRGNKQFPEVIAQTHHTIQYYGDIGVKVGVYLSEEFVLLAHGLKPTTRAVPRCRWTKSLSRVTASSVQGKM